MTRPRPRVHARRGGGYTGRSFTAPGTGKWAVVQGTGPFGRAATAAAAPTPAPAPGAPVSRPRLAWGVAALGLAALVAAVVAAPGAARAAADQDWPAFVLVCGLLLVGLVAEEDRLFAAGGHALARLSPNGVVLYVGAAVLVVAITSVLNLDTSVTFLTPVLVYAARHRGVGEAALLYGCLLLSNAGSLLLPGSNLTNLIVLGHLRLSGGEFFARHGAAGPGRGGGHRARRRRGAPPHAADRCGAGHRARAPSARGRPGGRGHRDRARRDVARALRCRWRWPPSGSPPCCGARWRSAPGGARTRPTAALRLLGLPLLSGLFGLAVALGTLGRSWSGPATLLAHLDAWGTAAAAAATSIVCNNLPAASLLAARRRTAPLQPADRVERGPQPLRHGLAGLGPLAARGVCNRRPPGRPAGQPPGGGQRTAGHGGGRGRPPRRGAALSTEH